MILPVFLPHLGCGNRCIYCNQYTITQKTAPADTLKDLARLFETTRGPVEVALYGGNPFGLDPGALDRLLRLFAPFLGRISGFRLSAKPGPVTRELISVLKAHAVRTIELGIPTFNDTILSLLQRGHTAEDGISMFNRLSREGFDMGIQLMVGLPQETSADLRRTVDVLTSLSPSYVRVYPLVVLEDTPLFDLFSHGDFRPDSLETAILKTSFIFASCWSQNIRVIKMGLTENEVLTTKIAAGPYHPAFGYLVKSDVFRLALEARCKDAGLSGAVMVHLHPSDIPHLCGFRRSNIQILSRQGISVAWTTDGDLAAGRFAVEGTTGNRAKGDLSDSLSRFPF